MENGRNPRPTHILKFHLDTGLGEGSNQHNDNTRVVRNAFGEGTGADGIWMTPIWMRGWDGGKKVSEPQFHHHQPLPVV